MCLLKHTTLPLPVVRDELCHRSVSLRHYSDDLLTVFTAVIVKVETEMNLILCRFDKREHVPSHVSIIINTCWARLVCGFFYLQGESVNQNPHTLGHACHVFKRVFSQTLWALMCRFLLCWSHPERPSVMDVFLQQQGIVGRLLITLYTKSPSCWFLHSDVRPDHHFTIWSFTLNVTLSCNISHLMSEFRDVGQC